MRPVSDGRASFGVLLARFGDIAAQTRRALDTQQRQLGAILDRAAQVAATVADPEAAAYEVDQVQRDTSVITTETDAQVAEQQARADRAVADQTAARDELERVRAQAAEQVAVAHADCGTVAGEPEVGARVAAGLARRRACGIGVSGPRAGRCASCATPSSTGSPPIGPVLRGRAPVELVTGTKDDAEALREEIAGVLSTMGLRLSPEKTLITHIDEGLDFLG